MTEKQFLSSLDRLILNTKGAEMSKPIDWKKIKAHPYCEMLPRHSDAEYEAIKNSIKTDGYDANFPVIIWDHPEDGDIVIDGLGRTKICRELGIEPTFERRKMTDEEAIKLVEKNVHRRQLTQKDRMHYALELAKSLAALKKAGEAEEIHGQRSTKVAADRSGVSERSLARAQKVMKDPNATEELKEAVKAGDVSPVEGVKLAKLDKAKQKQVVETVKKGGRKKGAASKAIKLDKSKCDEYGVELPVALRKVFDDRDEYEAIHAEAKRIGKRLEKINEGPSGKWWTRAYAKQLEGIAEAVQFNMPAAVCPDCLGKGCKRCQRDGWLIYGNGERPKATK